MVQRLDGDDWAPLICLSAPRRFRLGDASRTLTRSVERKATRVLRTRTKDCYVLVKELVESPRTCLVFERRWNRAARGGALWAAFGALWENERTRGRLRKRSRHFATQKTFTCEQSVVSLCLLVALLCHCIAVWARALYSAAIFARRFQHLQRSSQDITTPGLHKGRTREARRRASRSIAP